MNTTKRLSLISLLSLLAFWVVATGQTWIDGDRVSKYFYTNNGVATASLRTCAAALEGTFAYDTTTNNLTVCNGTAWVATGATISGLTTNVIPKATSATAIGNGSITDNGTNIIAASGVPFNAGNANVPSADLLTAVTTMGFFAGIGNDMGFVVENAIGAANGPLIYGIKTRDATGNANTVVVSGDSVLDITALAADGATFVGAGRINFAVDGTPGSNDMPSRIEFYTVPDGSATQTKQWQIDNTGLLYRKASGSAVKVIEVDRSADTIDLFSITNDEGSGAADINIGTSGALRTTNGPIVLDPVTSNTVYLGNALIGSNGGRNSAPSSVTISGTEGLGTDIVGGTVTLAGGISTGAGIGGDLVTRTSPSGSTGATANTLGDRSRVLAKYTTLTETTATAFARVAVAAGTAVGGEAVVTVEANDATDFQARTLRFGFSAVNKAGTTTAGIDTPSESVAVSSGTLTCTITAVDATANVDLKANCTSSLTQTTLRANAVVTAKNFGVGAISAQ